MGKRQSAPDNEQQLATSSGGGIVTYRKLTPYLDYGRAAASLFARRRRGVEGSEVGGWVFGGGGGGT